METLIFVVAPLLLMLVSSSSSINRLTTTTNLDKSKRILWHSEIYFYLLYLISMVLFGGVIPKIILTLGIVIGMIKRKYLLIKTLENQLEGITYLLLISYILVDPESAFLVSASAIIISINAGVVKLRSSLWNQYSRSSGLIKFLTTPWLARKSVREFCIIQSRKNKFFIPLLSFLSITVPWIQISAFLMIFSKMLSMNNMLLAMAFLQALFAIGIFVSCDLKYIPHLYTLLITCFFILPIPDAGFFFDYKLITISHWLLTAYIILFALCSLTPMSNPDDLLYKIRHYLRFFIFSATPLRLFTERDLTNMISYYISPIDRKNISLNPFNVDGNRKTPSWYRSICKPFCLTFMLSEFCYLTFSSNDKTFCRFNSEQHKKTCSILFKKLKGRSISFYQHEFQEEFLKYRSYLVARIHIPSNINEERFLDQIELERISAVLPLART